MTTQSKKQLAQPLIARGMMHLLSILSNLTGTRTTRFGFDIMLWHEWQHFLPESILLNVRWVCHYALSDRTLEVVIAERGVEADHAAINRWVLKYALE